ncbi:MAG: 23S rRNA (adenine(1618)-N(6))-methyltransferase RlmF [Winogradskyella sp.]|nr:23S rRNA (adenine(1618)-N(6))-methyltransferase RlmF [Winogradskyella sp.]
MSEASKRPSTKSKLHPRSKHRERYDFVKLIKGTPELRAFVKPNKYGDESINFFDPKAVKTLNKALLNLHYNIKYWDIPEQFLCPPIPGRVDYIHYLADLLSNIPKNTYVKGLDIGTGANCIYPLVGHQIYNWSFIGSDIDQTAVDTARSIVNANPSIKNYVNIRLQENPKFMFKGILNPDERIAFSMCNPPFHASELDAKKATSRKNRNLKSKRNSNAVSNFGGQHHELWTKGGEARFIKDMIYESRNFAENCLWFTTLVSKESNLKGIYTILKKVNAETVKTIEMGQGQKNSRIVAWTFLSTEKQKEWILN